MNIVKKRLLRVLLIATLCAGLASCEPPQVYGSVGYSSYSGGYDGGYSGSVRINRRIY